MKNMLSYICLLMLMFAAGDAFAAEKIGTVIGVKGSVSVQHAGDKNAAPLADKSAVYRMDRITTGEHSRVKLLMMDDSVLTLGQKADMTLQEYDYQAGSKRNAVTKLSTGNLKSVISKVLSGAGSKFEVHTPTAVAGARGTTNIAAVLSDTRTLVVGEEGSTEASNIDPSVEGTQTLGDGMGSYVDKGKPPTDPFKVPSDLLGGLDEDTTLSREPGFGDDDQSGFPLLNPGQPPVPQTPPIDQEPKPDLNLSPLM